MASPFEGYEVDTVLRPKSLAYAFDLEATLSSVVALEASVPVLSRAQFAGYWDYLLNLSD